VGQVKGPFKRVDYYSSLRRSPRLRRNDAFGMSLFAALLAPLALALPSPGGAPEAPASGLALPEPVAAGERAIEEEGVFGLIAFAFQPGVQNQVRIEQRVTIRVTPQPPASAPAMLAELPQRPLSPRPLERDIGRCLPASGIAGVQAGNGNRLLLFMRDRRVVSATLERACNARDFYSGFYVARSADGQICARRDSLLSRSGTNCKLSRIRQLVDPDD
jgi:hypothetical protein